MKENITVELSMEAAKTARAFFISQLTRLRNDREVIDVQLRSIESTVKAIDSKLNGGSSGQRNGDGQKSKPYGWAKKSIYDLFKALPPGTELKQSEVCLRAGTAQSSTYRTLAESGDFESNHGKWKLKQ